MHSCFFKMCTFVLCCYGYFTFAYAEQMESGTSVDIIENDDNAELDFLDDQDALQEDEEFLVKNQDSDHSQSATNDQVNNNKHQMNNSSQIPINHWNKQSADSAKTISQWILWWKYLFLKETITIDWIDQLKINIYPGNKICRALYIRGVYDPNQISIVRDMIPQNGVLIDVGANMGYFSLAVSTKLDTGHIIAIEPSNRDFQRLTANIQLNNLQNKILAINCGLSDTIEISKLHVACEENSSLNTFSPVFKYKGIEESEIQDVNVQTLDQIVENLHLQTVDFIKLDIEGSELKAINGAKKTIQKFHPHILIGTNPQLLEKNGSSINDLWKTLEDLGYVMYFIDYNPFRLVPIKDVKFCKNKFAFCIHNSINPPILSQPQQNQELFGLL